MQLYQQEDEKYRIAPSHVHDLIYYKTSFEWSGNKEVLNQE